MADQDPGSWRRRGLNRFAGQSKARLITVAVVVVLGAAATGGAGIVARHTGATSTGPAASHSSAPGTSAPSGHSTPSAHGSTPTPSAVTTSAPAHSSTPAPTTTAPAPTTAPATQPPATPTPLPCLTVPPPSNSGAAHITLSPQTCMADNTVVTVTAAGFTPSTNNWVIIECADPSAPSGDDCNTAAVQFHASDSSGSFTITVTALKNLPSNHPHTCSATEHCMITVSNIAGDIYATTFISFT